MARWEGALNGPRVNDGATYHLRHFELVEADEVRLVDAPRPLDLVVRGEEHPHGDVLGLRLGVEDAAAGVHKGHHVHVALVDLHDARLDFFEGQKVVEDVHLGERVRVGDSRWKVENVSDGQNEQKWRNERTKER